MAKVSEHGTLAGQSPNLDAYPAEAPLAQAGCSFMLLPAVSAWREGGEQGEGFTAHKSRCC